MVVHWVTLFLCIAVAMPVPMAAIFYFDPKLPYQDHPYREFKHFVFMNKVALVGSLFGICVLWLLHFLTGVGGLLLAVLISVGGNFTMAFVEVVRYPPYGVVNPLKIAKYFRYEKQQKGRGMRERD